MKVILLDHVENLGAAGEVVEVKNGYGRNWLIPQGLARLATKGVVRAQEEVLKQQVRRRAQEQANAAVLQAELERITLQVEARVGEDNRIFGTVTSQQVALALATQGFQINRRSITIDEDIKVLGDYTATVRLHAEVQAKVTLRVVPEEA